MINDEWSINNIDSYKRIIPQKTKKREEFGFLNILSLF